MRKASGSKRRMVWLGVVAAIVVTGGSAKADFTFGRPTNLGPTVNSSGMDASPSISTDGLELYFLSDRPGGYGNYDLWVTTRPTTDDPWGAPTNLGPVVNSPNWEVSPDISADSLSLYFDGGPVSRNDIWVAQRAAKDQPWGTPVKLGPNVNGGTWQWCPSISPDGLQLYWDLQVVQGASDIWTSRRQTQSDVWQPAVSLGSPVNTSYHDSGPEISSDGLAMVFHSNRPGGYGNQDLYVTTRPTIDSAWGKPLNLGPSINTAYSESDASVSADGRILYFSEYPNPRPGGVGGLDLWQAPIIPVVDFNGDGKVDSFEVCKMADRWGTDDSVCDIAPMPWGDGIVDVEDLRVLAECIGAQVDDPTLVARWALDETEGMTAHDSAGTSNGVLVGNPIWQPASGKIGGALQLDGLDDCVNTASVLDPAGGPFSVLAWVKGGASGQVVVSQEAGANWLMLDPTTGALMTELKSGSRSGKALYSDVVITDGAWNRVAFTWDGSHRRLYVDDVLVAEDTQDKLAASHTGIVIGCGRTMAPASFWKGLIDDVRIYDRAVTP